MLNQSLSSTLAKRFVLGYEGAFSEHRFLHQLIDAGLAGLIFFWHNLEDFETPEALQAKLSLIRQRFTQAGTPKPIFSIDQEGGAVVRLPAHLMPSLFSPLLVSQRPAETMKAHYAAIAETLAAYGFTLNFAPTLDVNTNPENRIIGVRAFGSKAEPVWQAGRIALEAHQAAGIIPVIKHFPGHGSGVIDSHEALPQLTYSEAELLPFQKAVELGAPAVLVSHGQYTNLAQLGGDSQLPASLSQTVIQGLLRERLGFEGVVFSDDMEMGALTQSGLSEVECAIKALNAGCDVLVYRNAGPAFEVLFRELLQACEQGALDAEQHEKALGRIAALNASQKQKPLLEAQALTRLIRTQHEQASSWLESTLLPMKARLAPVFENGAARQPWRLLLPEPASMGNYRLDLGKADFLTTLLRQTPPFHPEPLFYNDTTDTAALIATLESEQPEGIVFVSWLPRLGQNLLPALRHWANERAGQGRNVAVIHWLAGSPEAQPYPHSDPLLALPLHSCRADQLAFSLSFLFKSASIQ